MALFAIVTLAIIIYMVSGQSVYVVKCDDQYHLYTGLRADGEEVLEHLGIELDRHDQVTQKDGDILSRIDVTRAYTVTLQVDGGSRTVYTVGESVNTILQREGVELGTYDAVSPEGEDIPRAGSSIVVSRGTVEYEEESVRIPYHKVKVESNDYYVGTTIKTTDGKEGEAINKYALIYRDGELVSRELVSKTVVTEAEDAYYIVGTQAGAESSVKAKLTIKSTEVEKESETTTKKPSSSSSSSSSNKKPSSSSSSSSNKKPSSSSSSSSSSGSSSSNLGGSTGFGGQKGTITVTENGDGTGTVTTVGGKTYKYKKAWLMTATAFSHKQTALGVTPGWG
ncbi:MAG: G5 domain-containing protein, partial [Clostridia bacterium]|nr:G5 domain-containing protein [Clostridia bacterium]